MSQCALAPGSCSAEIELTAPRGAPAEVSAAIRASRLATAFNHVTRASTSTQQRRDHPIQIACALNATEHRQHYSSAVHCARQGLQAVLSAPQIEIKLIGGADVVQHLAQHALRAVSPFALLLVRQRCSVLLWPHCDRLLMRKLPAVASLVLQTRRWGGSWL